MSVHARETRSTFIFHKPDNSTTVIYIAALHVRWYSISERLSFSLCKVSFPSHLKLICIHLGKKELQLLGSESRSRGEELSCVWLLATPWTVQSMELSRPEYGSGEPVPSPGDLPNPGIKPRSPALQADSLPSEPPGSTKVKVKVAQSCPTLGDPINYMVHWILQARILE